jgi:Clr5 domain
MKHQSDIDDQDYDCNNIFTERFADTHIGPVKRNNRSSLRASSVANNPGSDVYAAPREWEAHRATIRRLYLGEDKTLKEVMTYMEQKHSFRAT